jgi:hypothetical protein
LVTSSSRRDHGCRRLVDVDPARVETMWPVEVVFDDVDDDLTPKFRPA